MSPILNPFSKSDTFKMKWQATAKEKMFAIHGTDKGLVCRKTTKKPLQKQHNIKSKVLNIQFTEAIQMHNWHRKRCPTLGFKECKMKPQGNSRAYLPNGENLEQL